jgi:hypothetical protein
MLPNDSPETQSERLMTTLGAGQKWYDFLTVGQESAVFQHIRVV